MYGDLQILVPCGSKDVVCARGREWASNSTDFCHLAGFALEGVDIKLRNGAQVSCYDGRGEPASSMGEKRGSSKKKESKAQKSTSLLDMLNDWAEHVGVSEKVLWAIGGLVLTAGAALLRCILPPSIRVCYFSYSKLRHQWLCFLDAVELGPHAVCSPGSFKSCSRVKIHG